LQWADHTGTRPVRALRRSCPPGISADTLRDAGLGKPFKHSPEPDPEESSYSDAAGSSWLRTPLKGHRNVAGQLIARRGSGRLPTVSFMVGHCRAKLMRFDLAVPKAQSSRVQSSRVQSFGSTTTRKPLYLRRKSGRCLRRCAPRADP